MQPPAWADFEPGALMDDAPAPPAPPEPEVQPQDSSLGEISVDTMDLSGLELPEKRPAPYALSMLILDALESNV